jgi:acetyltransferase-like isoleucine patch superfamily enzyme
MDLIITALKFLKCNLKMIVYKVIFFNILHTPKILKSSNAPSIRIRKNGEIELGDVNFRFGNYIFCDGGKLKIGDNCFFNRNCSINCVLSIKIGKGTIFGENVKIYDHDHAFTDDYIVSLDLLISDKINIGNNCWIGSNVIILKGVSITNNVIIASGSIISHDILTPGVYASSKLSLRKIK